METATVDEHALADFAADDLTSADFTIDDLAIDGELPPRAWHALAQIEHGLQSLFLPTGVADSMSAMLRCVAAHAEVPVPPAASEDDISNEALLDAVSSARRLQGFADAVVIQACRTLSHRAGRELLDRKKVSNPSELTAPARGRWRAKTKSIVAQEVSTLTGYGVQNCHARVGFALAPQTAVASAEAALASGGADWRGVSEFWQRCRTMQVEDAARVAESVFGPCLLPTSAEEAQDRVESWAEFHRRLSREVVRVEGEDAQMARKRRREALDTRDVSGEICDDGIGTFTVMAGAASVAAALERIETIARRARKGGDGRPLGHLRSDTVMSLIVHGTLDLPSRESGGLPAASGRSEPAPSDTLGEAAESATGSAASDDLLLPTSADTCRIVSGLPTATVEVIVPVGALMQGASLPAASNGAPVPASGEAPVAEIPGRGFVSAEHARDLTLTPGTTMHRLLMDPADGRVVERSLATYRPDAAMIAQVRASDRSCRAPGCLAPAHRCELDHERPYGTAGGITSETNLNAKHSRHHQLKTEEFWRSVMDETRNVTWTTFFDRMYRTSPHDYRQYETSGSNHSAIDPSADAACGDGACGAPTLQDPGSVQDEDLRNQLVYAALCSRAGQDTWLEGMDDYEDCPLGLSRERQLPIFHRRDGRRRRGPSLGQKSPEELLELPPAPIEPAPTDVASEVAEPPPPF